uniref:Monocarboxylate transporter n=1 Tax=Timema cristinae TaxID=61476 RepID=A0A7R9CNR2_TIMCR|nr:unnamed protein product [Timema cristinae]
MGGNTHSGNGVTRTRSPTQYGGHEGQVQDWEQPLQPPEGGWGWMVAFGMALIFISTTGQYGSFGLLFDDVLSRLGEQTTGATLIMNALAASVNFTVKTKLLNNQCRVVECCQIPDFLRLILGAPPRVPNRVLLTMPGLPSLDSRIRGLAERFFTRAQASSNMIVRGIGDYDAPGHPYRRIRNGVVNPFVDVGSGCYGPRVSDSRPGNMCSEVRAQNPTAIVRGIGLGMVAPSSYLAFNSYFLERRGLAMGLCQAGIGLGFIVAPPLVQYLLEDYGYRGTMLILSGIALNGVVGAVLYQPVRYHLVRKAPKMLDKESEMVEISLRPTNGSVSLAVVEDTRLSMDVVPEEEDDLANKSETHPHNGYSNQLGIQEPDGTTDTVDYGGPEWVS